MKKDPQQVGDCEIGDIVRCHVGLIIVGPTVAGDALCRMVESSESGFAVINRGNPLMVKRRTPVLQRLRDRTWYNARPSRVSTEVDPLLVKL